MPSKSSINVHEKITAAVVSALEKFINQSLNKTNCTLIYQEIFMTVSEIVETANLFLSNEAVNFIAQSFYDSVKINNTQELDPSIFSQRAKIENIPTKELTIICVLFQGTELGLQIARVIKNRG